MSAPKRGGWLRKLAYVASALVVLLVVAWFVVTSSGFFKGVILPRVGKALNAEVTVADASVSPLSRVVLHDLKVTPKGAEPLLTAGEVRARYSLLAILRGNILVDEVAVVNSTITLVENADGTSNLDPLLKALEPTEDKKPAKPAKPSPPPALDIKAVRLNNATVRQTKHLKDGGRDVIEVSNLNVTLTDLKNGQTGKLDIAATVAMDQAAQASAPASSLAGKLAGAFTFDLAQDLKPTSLNGNATLTVDKAAGAFADFAALTVRFDAQASPTEIKQLAVQFSRAAESLGELRVSGPFDAEKLEGKLKVELNGVDKKLLNLAGAANGLDFGGTTVGLTGNVELTQAGSRIAANGQLNVVQFQVTRDGQTTPTLDLRCEYEVAVDNTAEAAVLKSLNLAGTQGARPLLQASLTAPMTIAWGSTANAVGDSALNLTVNALDLADWKPFIGDVAPAGKVDVTAKLLSQQAGQRLQFEAKVDANNLVVLAGTNRFAGLSVGAEASGEASELKRFKLSKYAARLAHNGQQVLSAEGAGNCDTGAKTADADARVLVALPALVQLLGVPDVTAASGAVELQSRLTHNDTTQTATGKVLLVGFTGGYGETRLADFGLETEFDVAKTDQTVQLRKAVGKVTERMQGCGDFEATGNYDLAASAGDATLKLAGLNQNALRPFLAAALGDKRLVSLVVNSSVTANLAANGDASAKADLHVTNLVVNDPKGALPSTPLEARLQADATVAKQVAQVRQLLLTLTPTERAKNELSLDGSVDFSKSNAVTGHLKLAAEALDVTRYYDLFAGDATTTKPAPATAPATDPTKEPDAMPLPFRNFTFDASIGRFHLREVAITNLQATAKLDGGHVVVKPFQFTLNGAPVSATADLDLGVPGFKYDVNLSADKVPLAPLVNSFVPERKGQMGGVTTMGAQIKGAGVTGAGLQKNLTGQFSVLSTNLNLSIANVRSPVANAIINVIVGIPDLIRNPTAIVGNLLGSLTGADRPRGGWADQLTAAPIDVIVVRGNAGAGRVELQAAEIRSTAFQAQAGGGIGLEPILTNSTLQIPLTVSFSRAMADRVGLVTADIPTNQVYVALPDFVSLKGTVGEPKADINKLALAGLAARTGAGVVKQIGGASGGKAGDILGAVGSLLGGGTTAPGTNAPTATNRPPADPAGNLLRGLGGILGGGRTSAPATNAPTPPR
jgi:uncharacterized protein involved in outer membrane biogenesis